MNQSYIHTMTKRSQKRGFALLITLSVLTVLISLTAVLLNYFDTVRKDAVVTKAMIQGNLYYTDITKMIQSFKEKKSLFSTLYMTPVPLVSPDGRFNVMIECHPRANGVNINWLGKENDLKWHMQFKTAQALFEAIAQNYALEDASRLEEMLLLQIQGKEAFVKVSNHRLLQKNGIMSFQQFKSILQQYQFETDDQKVSSVPWQKYFVFGDTGRLIDGDYLSTELIALLFNMDKETVKAEWTAGSMKLKDFLQQMGKPYESKLYAQEFLEEVSCKVAYHYQDEPFVFSFIDTQGEVKDFEFHGKQ